MTQQELAEKVGVQRRWVHELESGENNSTLDPLLRCMEVLGLGLSIQLSANAEPLSAPSALDRVISRLRDDPTVSRRELGRNDG